MRRGCFRCAQRVPISPSPSRGGRGSAVGLRRCRTVACARSSAQRIASGGGRASTKRDRLASDRGCSNRAQHSSPLRDRATPWPRNSKGNGAVREAARPGGTALHHRAPCPAGSRAPTLGGGVSRAARKSSTLNVLARSETAAGFGVSSARSSVARSMSRSRSGSGRRRIVARISSRAPMTGQAERRSRRDRPARSVLPEVRGPGTEPAV
jgi:hypothetical protein